MNDNVPARQMDTYGFGEMIIPMLKVIQNVGGEYAKNQLQANPGDLFFPINDTVISGSEGMNVIVVDVRKSRTYWGRDEIGEDPPQCSSIDGLVSQDGKDCANCPQRHDAPWLLSRKDRREKCLLNFDILAVDLQTSLPVLIRTHGISIQAARELITQLKMNSMLKGEIHRAVVKVTTVKKKSEAGEAYSLKFKITDIKDKESAKPFLQLTTQILGAKMLLPGPQEISDQGEESVVKELWGIALSDPEMRFTPSGIPVTNFPIQTKEYPTITVVTWREAAEKANEIVKKGNNIYVKGKVELREWEKQDGSPGERIEITAYSFQVISAKEQADKAEQDIKDLWPEPSGPVALATPPVTPTPQPAGKGKGKEPPKPELGPEAPLDVDF